MLKKFTTCALISSMLMLPIGCAKTSNRQNYDNNLAKRQMYNSKAKSDSYKYAFKALGKIMDVYEEQKESSVVGNSAKAMFTYTAFDNTGKKIIGKYEMADITAGYVDIINKITISSSRERVVREFVPIFRGIADSMVSEGKAPKSWIDVANEFVKHVPMMATMGAMYGLSAAAIDSAGNVINNNLSDDSKLELNSINGDDNILLAGESSLVTNHTDIKINGTDIGNDKSSSESTEVLEAMEEAE